MTNNKKGTSTAAGKKKSTRTTSDKRSELKAELKSVAGIDARRDIMRIIVASLFLIIGIFLAISLISNIFTGPEDQAYVIAHETFRAANKGGMAGAYCAHFLMDKLFGFAALVVPFYLIVVAMKMIMGRAARRLHVWALTIHCTAIIAVISLDMACLSDYMPYSVRDLFSFRLGGMSGEEIVGMLTAYIGPTTAAILLAGLTLAYLGYWFTQIFIWIFKGIHRLGRFIFGAPDNEYQEGDAEEDTAEAEGGEDGETDGDGEETEGGDAGNGEEPCITIDLTDIPAPAAETGETAETEETAEPAMEEAAKEESTPQPSEPSPATTDENGGNDIQMGINVAEAEAAAGSKTLEGDQEDSGLFDPKRDLSRYKYPTISLLERHETPGSEIDMLEQNENKERIITVLRNFGVEIESIQATIGPTVTLYEIKPAQGVRIARIRNLEDDIALSLSALGIRIIAPIPGKGTIGIEVPNKKAKIVSMESVINTQKFRDTKYDLPIALGKTITNEIFMVDLAKMPHLLVAGATGQGKSVGLNAIITSLLYKKHPSELKLVMIDPKKVEFSMYAPLINHFLAMVPDSEEPVITDVKKVVATLKSLCQEMDERYDLLKLAHCRNIKEYNDKFCHRHLNPANGHHYMPYIVVIIDEFGDLIMTAGKEVELPIARIAQLARAVGIHMIIATQSPRATIITGKIKANFPGRMAFKVAQRVESQTILDRSGANNLIGRGDMLFQAGSEITRVQCAFIDTPEIEAITEYISKQQAYPSPFELPLVAEDSGDGTEGIASSDGTSTFEQVARYIVNTQTGSTSKIQRIFSVGFNRAGRLMDQMEEAGIVGPQNGSKPREVLVQSEIELSRILQALREQGKKFE